MSAAHAASRRGGRRRRGSTWSRPRAGASGRPRPLDRTGRRASSSSCAPTARRSTTCDSDVSLAELPDRRPRDRRHPRRARGAASRAASTAGRPSDDLHYDAGFLAYRPNARSAGPARTWRWARARRRSGSSWSPTATCSTTRCSMRSCRSLPRGLPRLDLGRAVRRGHRRRRRQGLRHAAGVRSSRHRRPKRWSPSATTTTTSPCSQWAGRGIAMGNAQPVVLDDGRPR